MHPWVGAFLIWLAIGAVTMAAIGVAVSRDSDGKKLFPDSSLAEAFILCTMLIAGGPLLLLFVLGVAASELWAGKLPISGRIWWPARAMMREGPPNLDTTLCEMIALRRRRDERIRGRGNPSTWPVAELRKSTEGMLALTSEQYHLLRDDGLLHSQAVARLEAYRTGSDHVVAPLTADLRAYLAYLMEMGDPAYLHLGGRLFDRAIAIATQHSLLRIKAAKGAKPFPPSEWFTARIDPASPESPPPPIDAPAYLAISEESGIAELKLRMLEGDEIWTFSSPRETWETLCGRAGIVLVRKGRAVAHIVTEMN
ncbi:MAG: hypothetical protein AB7J30_12380 [Hyphomicrobium sp.]|uniref:hypothetical protein n=1 Tax=Hyphomicrobium sp. TaxID=82 RepID=UPI003D09BFF9